MKKMIVAAALTLLPTLAAAQSSFEVTPFTGYMAGGSIRVIGPDLVRDPDSTVIHIVNRRRDVKVETGQTWGLRFNKQLNWGPNLQLEGIFERTQSQLEDNQALFGELPGGPVPQGDLSYTDVSTTYVHGGVLWLIGKGRSAPYDIRPYVVGTVGVAMIRFHEIPLSDQTRPSLGAGVGVKWGLTERLALRLETRGYATSTSKSAKTVTINLRDCPNCQRTYSYSSTQLQQDITAGLTLKF